MQSVSSLAPHGSTAAQATVSGTPTTAPGTGGSTIIANDFLTLLVTELKNQDPTQPSDPTQYIQQLVGVNSLEQLININTQLGALKPATTTPPATHN